MEVFVFFTIGELLAYILILLIFGGAAIAGFTSFITSFLVKYFTIIVFAIIIITVMANLWLVLKITKNENRINKLGFSINIFIASFFNFPLFYMFFLEFMAVGFVERPIDQILKTVESIIGMVIACGAGLIYLGIISFMATFIGEGINFLAKKIEYFLKRLLKKKVHLKKCSEVVLWIVILGINLFILAKAYRFCIRLFDMYYCADDALEMYKANFPSGVYKFAVWVKKMEEVLPFP